MARKTSKDPTPPQPAAREHHEGADGAAGDLSYSQARTALELVLAELQASDLDVEAMIGLYRRGQAYARRCGAILDQVEQDVLLWDALNDPDAPPQPGGPLSSQD
ncbi:exodeoxyribonuclease VII small subunit [Cyanobium sp. CH-040]|uniref:exodeoxyribonuclease VII small subunit n=1 Tax=Cyanobium sp. CH-040 TaxID=2823708 RepID=UPI0020CCD062|nr:exodeoxyribonuclease VII small subunit [Cyanobium sp. CH-040]MCP9927224.1 exodeoxyribonuclease VII small subunit [Cyanobium sp. CH-040]